MLVCRLGDEFKESPNPNSSATNGLRPPSDVASCSADGVTAVHEHLSPVPDDSPEKSEA